MATIYIENKPYEVDGSKNLLDAILSLGFDLPYFCWHPAMGSVGACRQCAVKIFRDEQDTKGKIAMACMTPATDGTRLSLDDPDAKFFRKSVIEWMMTNHPHDCPVCDEGGECHLQDMTVMTGHDYRRCRFPKRTFNNQYLGPFVNHEMNRCIQCYRCVRFYRDYAGGRDFNAFGIHNGVYFGRHEDGVLENEFSGNLVEICPTGVFTDKTLKKYYTRKWDYQTAPSICVHCGLGCNTTPGERYGELRRVRNRFNGEVNGYFLCDRGRYGYEFVNSGQRMRKPLARGETGQQVISKEAALRDIASMISPEKRVIGIGSPRASLEANFALMALVGDGNFYRGISAQEDRLMNVIVELMRKGPARTPSLRDIQSADAMVVLGEDITNTAPIMALSIRQRLRLRPTDIEAHLNIPPWNDSGVGELVKQTPSPLFVATVYPTKLEDAAGLAVHAAPDDLAILGFAVAQALGAPRAVNVPTQLQAAVEAISSGLRDAKHVLIVTGTSCGNEAVLYAAAQIARTLIGRGTRADTAFIAPECNSLGIQLLGGKSLESADFDQNPVDAAIILENDIERRVEPELANALFKKCHDIIVLDHLANATTAKASVVLPCGTFAESDGTFVSFEGRAQRFYQVFVPSGDVQESWRWLRDVMAATGLGTGAGWQTLDDVIAAMAEAIPAMAAVATIAPTAEYRVDGMKVARQPHRYSGRTAMNANVAVSEPKPPADPDSPLSFSMEGFQGQPPPALIPFFWTPGWNSIQALNKFQQEVGGPLRGGDPGVLLIEPGDDATATAAKVPEPFEPKKNIWLMAPIHHIFGSEELSALSPPVAEITPKPYVMLNAEDAALLNLASGDAASVMLGGQSVALPVVIETGLPRGMAGLPVGLRELPLPALPALGAITRGAAP